MSKRSSSVRGTLQPGTALSKFTIEAVLGYGGYGVVYRASHRELGHQVAIKEYLPADLSIREEGTVYPRSPDCSEIYEDGKRRFLEEAKQIIEFKDDPGVVTCTDFFRANGTAYLVMEYVEGLSLSDLLRQREAAGLPFSEEDLKSVAGPLLETLSRLHRAQVLHRDIKPSNILLRRSDGQPVLIDFGAAKQLTEAHSKSAAPFTEGYAAIEQVGDGELGPWTDLYAFGALLWRMVAGGKPPWEPPNPKRVELRAAAVLDGKLDPLPSAAELGAGRFSRRLLSEIDRSLTVSVDTRPRDLDHLRKVLDSESQLGGLPHPLNSEVQPVPEPATDGRSRRWLSTTTLHAALAGVAVFMAVAGLAWVADNSNNGFLPLPETSTAPADVVPNRVVPRESDTGALTQPVSPPDKVAIIEEDIAPPVQTSPPPPVKRKSTPKRSRVGGNAAKARLTHQVRPQYPPLARQARIQGTVKLSAVISKDGTIQKLEVLSGHPLLVPAALAAVKQWRYRPTLLSGDAVEVLTNIDVNFTLSEPDNATIVQEDSARPSAGIADVQRGSAPAPPPVKKKSTPKRIRLGSNVAKARLARQVRPQYPPLARQARIQGTVKLSAVISKDGTIQKLEVLSGHPLLVPAALAAVKQWRYRPTLLNGEAVEVLTNIDVNFILSG